MIILIPLEGAVCPHNANFNLSAISRLINSGDVIYPKSRFNP